MHRVENYHQVNVRRSYCIMLIFTHDGTKNDICIKMRDLFVHTIKKFPFISIQLSERKVFLIAFKTKYIPIDSIKSGPLFLRACCCYKWPCPQGQNPRWKEGFNYWIRNPYLHDIMFPIERFFPIRFNISRSLISALSYLYRDQERISRSHFGFRIWVN